MSYAQTAVKKPSDGATSGGTKKEYAMGFFSGVHLNQASTKTNGSTVNMKGSSFPIGAFFDGRINAKYGYQLSFANEPYMVEGNSDVAMCGSSATNNCDININYFGLGGVFVYNIATTEKMKARAYGGVTFLFPQTKTSNVLDIGAQGTNFNAKIGVGLDLSVNEYYYVPIDLGINYFPNIFPNKNDFSTVGTTIHIGFGIYLN
ncbi:MAG: hypothetical protein H7235_04630 [Bdellovibrionaceae bacterium]|nr:hypothetical protein [Pseudobdellovibrionaceae bacterium]